MADEGVRAVEVTVGVPVKDLAGARGWYARLLGKEPELEPVPGIVEFRVGGTWLQLEEGERRPKGWVFRIGVPDLQREWDRLAELGIPAREIQTVPEVIRFFDLADPDGNHLSFYQLLSPAPG